MEPRRWTIYGFDFDVKGRAIVLALSLTGLAFVCHGADSAPVASYYDAEPEYRVSYGAAAPAAFSPSQRPRRILRVETESGTTEAPVSYASDSRLSGRDASAPGVLPPRMEKGVQDLEAGLDELQKYTALMAAHVQKNGLRGFLAVPAEVKAQGTVVGHTIGGGVNGIMSDVAAEMTRPQ